MAGCRIHRRQNAGTIRTGRQFLKPFRSYSFMAWFIVLNVSRQQVLYPWLRAASKHAVSTFCPRPCRGLRLENTSSSTRTYQCHHLQRGYRLPRIFLLLHIRNTHGAFVNTRCTYPLLQHREWQSLVRSRQIPALPFVWCSELLNCQPLNCSYCNPSFM